jgi:AcrR family transcriptional regulator
VIETRRRQIEDVAGTLFRKRGYAATSVRDIARALEMQGASLYAHVASKEDVLWAIVERAADRFADAVGPIAEREAPAAERLRAMIREHVRVVAEQRDQATVFLHEWRFLGESRREAVADRRDAYEALFRRVIAEGVSTGEFRTADVKLAATAVLSALNGIAAWYSPGGPLTADAIADNYADLFLAALTCPPHASTPAPTPDRRTDR